MTIPSKSHDDLIWKANNVNFIGCLVKKRVLNKAVGRGFVISHPSPNSCMWKLRQGTTTAVLQRISLSLKRAESKKQLKQQAGGQNQSTCSQTRGSSQESASTEKVGHEKFGPVDRVVRQIPTRVVVPWSSTRVVAVRKSLLPGRRGHRGGVSLSAT
jgi:hypothetical protein